MVTDITVIIPIYNGDYCLKEAITSVIEQTYPNWKMLLVDDCSTDKSKLVIEEYLNLDTRIDSMYHSTNCGLYGSLVKAIDYVESEWIVILMQDDHLKPSYLEEMTNLVSKYSSQSKAFWATEDVIDEKGNLLRQGLDTARCEMINHGVSSWISILSRGCIWIISGSFTSRSLLLENPFRTDLPHCGDYEWLLRVIKKYNFVYYERPLSEIRIHAKAASATNLKIGRDIQEQYAILKQNLLDYREDIAFTTVISICFQRGKLITRRVLGQLVRGEFTFSILFFRYTILYLCLPFRFIKNKTY
ncbi:glycosyltransferase family 2 protein [Nodularia sphaerocarpa]|uniref:glycosyltransferase family 2 protein n=1 Tax=Nodularia sphaerocarpa TaxID=137816 RepID=UPI001EFAD651|nr:glycosyltransferase [Nodularia sphaerocarpa]MDB9375000.1 glycosyltransferase [Nodularia sphaerocarpa CS-585]MDB9378381.1 glycosyltransferase [Nodularia sphaerocarpa CS-585A2]